MPISTKLFNEQTIRGMGVLGDRIATLQERVSTGRADTRPSADLVAAVRLSASKEIASGLERYSSNLSAAQNRLELSDTVLGEMGNIMTRLLELAVQASNDTMNHSDRQAIRAEVIQQHDLLVGLANTEDAQGQALFGGYRTEGAPFRVGSDGAVGYHGDSGQHTLRVSDSQSLATGVDGASAFMRVETATGVKPLFEIVEEFAAALATSGQTRAAASVDDRAELTIAPARAPQNHSFRLTGPLGTATVSVDLVDGYMQPAIDAINALSSETGIVATAGAGANGVRIAASDGLGNLVAGRIAISDYQIEGTDGASDPVGTTLLVQGISADGDPVGEAAQIADADHPVAVSTQSLRLGISHLANQRTRVGAAMNVAEVQSDVVAKRELLIRKALSELQDADLAEVVAELQSLLVNREATQQVFARIGQQSLFDFIR
jgi:flagellar hook-associated protein 3 FlgL